MILNDISIREMIANGCIMNTEDRYVNPASLNIRLSGSYSRIKPHPDLSERGVYEKIKPIPYTLGEKPDYETFTDDNMVIYPEEFILAATMEYFAFPNDISGIVKGRSSIGRIGLSVQNAGFIDPGFNGTITLELKNDSVVPIRLPKGYPIGQVIFLETMLVSRPYSGKYNGQVEATGSKLHEDHHEKHAL